MYSLPDAVDNESEENNEEKGIFISFVRFY